MSKDELAKQIRIMAEIKHMKDKEISEELGLSLTMIGKIRRKYEIKAGNDFIKEKYEQTAISVWRKTGDIKKVANAVNRAEWTVHQLLTRLGEIKSEKKKSISDNYFSKQKRVDRIFWKTVGKPRPKIMGDEWHKYDVHYQVKKMREQRLGVE